MSAVWVLFPGQPLYDIARTEPDAVLNPDGTVSLPLGGPS